MRKMKLCLLIMTMTLISSCEFIVSSSSNQKTTISNCCSNNSSNTYNENKVHFVSANEIEFKIELNSNISFIEYDDINVEHFNQLFNIDLSDEDIKRDYDILYYLRIEPVISNALDNVTYTNLYVENGELYVTRNYEVTRNFVGDSALSYYRELFLIPKQYKDALEDELSLNVTKRYLEDSNNQETTKVALSDLLPWVRNLTNKSIVRVEFEEYYVGVSPSQKYNCYYSEDSKIIKNVYEYLKSIELKTTNELLPPGGVASSLIIKTNNDTYTLRKCNNIYSINGKNYVLSYSTGFSLSQIENFYGQKFTNHGINGKLMSNEVFLEDIPDFYDKLVFIEDTENKVIDITTDFYIEAPFGNLYIVDEKHFSLINNESGKYEFYEIVGNFDFKIYFDKYYLDGYNEILNYVTLTLKDGEEEYTLIKCDRDSQIEVKWLLTLINDYYDTLINGILDEEGTTMTQIIANDDKIFALDINFESNLEAQYINVGYLDFFEIKNFGVAINSKEELDSYYETNKVKYDYEYMNVHNFKNAITKYDEGYFTNKSLIILVIEETSGSNRLEVKSCGVIDGKLIVDINRLVPTIGTCDMSLWHVIVEVDKELTSNVEGVELKLNTVMITDIEYAGW